MKENISSFENYDIVSAKTQTSGRGRRGNVWLSPEGMALFSFLLKPEKTLSIIEATKLPLLAGVSTLTALKKIKDGAYSFKWTNDVFFYGKKLCGILMEKADDVYIVGIGLNVNNILPKFLENKAISLTQIKNKKYEIDEIITNIVYEFKLLFKHLENGFWKEILSQINEINYLKNI